MKLKLAIVGLLISLSVVVIAQTSRGTPANLRVRVDANNNLLTISAGAQVPPVTTTTFANARLAVDANGNLLVVGSGAGGVTGGPCGPNTFVRSITANVITCSSLADSPTTLGTQITLGNINFGVGTIASNIGGFENTNTVTAIAFSTAAPALTSGWGGSPTTESKTSDSSGRVTLGTAPNATTLTLTFASLGGGTPPVCFVQNESTGTSTRGVASAGVLTITGTFAATNVISWMCEEHRGS